MTWAIRHQVLWPNEPFDYVKISTDEEGIHLGCFVDDELVAVISGFINHETKEAQFRKFATLPEEQGKGYGTLLLSHLIKEMTERGAKRIWCNARLNATSLYERHGMHKTDQYFEKGGFDYVVMEMVVD